MSGSLPGSSLAERALGVGLLLLLAALAVRAAVHIFLSVLWPLIGFGVSLAALAIVWQFWQRHRGGW